MMTRVFLTGKESIRNNLGEARSLVSQMAHEDPSIDEEELFTEIVNSYFTGLTRQVTELFGVDRATSLLDIFRNNDQTK